MGRSPLLRKNALWMSAVATILGLVFTVLAFTHDGRPAGWNSVYESTVPTTAGQDWNLLVQILAPTTLVAGGWYLVEQIMARRTYNEIMGLEKKSEFNQRLQELKEAAGKLPKQYEERVREKEEDFRSRR